MSCNTADGTSVLSINGLPKFYFVGLLFDVRKLFNFHMLLNKFDFVLIVFLLISVN